MPYHIVKRGTKFVVEKQDGSRSFGTHDTEAEAKRQLAALYAVEPKAAEDISVRILDDGSISESRHLHLLGATGQSHTEVWNGKEYLVVPVVALMEGVIHAVNAETPEFVPFDTIRQAAASWNDCPVTLGHPKKDGKQCSASSPDVIASHGIGVVRNSHVDLPSKKLLQEAWIEKAKAKRLNPDMFVRLENGESVEVSVGAYVATDSKPSVYKGKQYSCSWLETTGDHLAFLPGGRGACSLEMGCGTHRAAMRVCANGLEEVKGVRYAVGALSDKSEVRVQGGAMKVGDKVKVNKPGHDAHGKTGAITSSARGGTVHTVGDYGTFHQSELRAASIIDLETLKTLRDIPQSERDKLDASDFAGPDQSFPIVTQADVDAAKSLIGKAKDPEAVKRKIIAIAKRKGLKIPDAWMKAAQDSPEEAASEEAAELVAYNAMRTLMDAVGDQWDQASQLIDDLIADETENPTETSAEEDAEEEVETSRIEAIRTICSAMQGSLSSLMSVTYGTALTEDAPEVTPRYMAGARNSAADMAVIQDMHDKTMSLGATCDRSNLKMLEEHKDTSNPTLHYIDSVRRQAGKR